MQTTPRHKDLHRPSGPEAVRLEVFRHLFTALAEEMGAALKRASFSPNIKERQDYSCALFSPGGLVVAQGDHMPVHLGAMPRSVRAVIDELGPLEQGDVAILNDPFRGGTHLPDITVVAPVHEEERGGEGAGGGRGGGERTEGGRGEPGEGRGGGEGRSGDGGRRLGYVAARAHHADVGGMVPGSMPLAREIYQEGVRIPPLLLVRRGRPNGEVLDLLLANVRTPDERSGDLDAQLAALHTGGRRLREIARGRGPDATLAAMDDLIDYADRLVAEGIRRIPPGEYGAEDTLDDDGFGSGPIPIRVRLAVEEDRVRVDFAGSAGQVEGSVNAVAAITESATRYVFRMVLEELLGLGLPAGGGSFRAVELALPERSVVNAAPPAAVAGGNVETSQRITDVLLLAFTEALPDRMPALSQGTMNNLTVGGSDPRGGSGFAYYETVGGGMGAGPSGPGLSGVHTHMTNSLNTPVEALEHAYPLRVEAYGLRRRSGGGGLHRGGDGLRRDLRLLAPGEVTILSERRARGPRGARGGGDGAPGANVLVRDGEEKALPGKVTFRARAGDVVSIRTPGGGGWGRPPGDAGQDADRDRTPADGERDPGPDDG